MQIGNFLQYDNVDALGNTLTYSDPCKFNAKFKGSNCLYTGNVFTYFGPSNSLGDVRKLTLWVRRPSTYTSAVNFLYNFFPKIDQTGTYCSYWAIPAYTGTTNTLYIGKRRVTIENNWWSDGDWHFIEWSYTGSYELPDEMIVKIDGIQQVFATNTTNGNSRQRSSVALGNSYMDHCDIRTYDSNGNLTHHWPCAEGYGRILYDVIGNVHGSVQSNANTTLWTHTQDFYHYNVTNGYISIDGDDCNRFTNTLKVPLKDPSEILIMHDRYQCAHQTSIGVLNYAKYGGNIDASYINVSLQNEAAGNYVHCTVTDGIFANGQFPFSYNLLTEFNGQRYSSSISSPNLSPNYNYWNNINPPKSTTYRLKFKYRFNAYSRNGTPLSTLTGYLNFMAAYANANDVLKGYRVNNPTISNEWVEVDSTATNIYSTYNTNLATTVNAFIVQIQDNSANVDDTCTLSFDIKDIELYRCSNNTYHPPITNGHNGAETLLDFTQQGSTNVAEIQKPILADYRYGLIQSSDRSMGANGSMRANGWQGAMAAASQTARTTINNGVWAVMYNPASVGNTSCGYIDNYELTASELAMMGLSSTGVKANAVQFTSGTSTILGNGAQYCGLFYRLQYSTLLGFNSSNVSINKSIYNQQYNVRFTGWLKRLTEYQVTNCYLGLSYANIATIAGTGFSNIINTDNNWHYVDIVFPLQAIVHSNGSNNKIFGITCHPTDYTSYINPDTGEAYTAAEAYHRPCLALADVKIVIEPAEVYSKDGTNFKLYNLSINQWSEPQYKRIENQTNFKL